MSHVLHAVADGQQEEEQVYCQGQAWDLPWLGAPMGSCVEIGLLDGQSAGPGRLQIRTGGND
eukprot:790494-Alexandrium_andersonii.AAC.1